MSSNPKLFMSYSWTTPAHEKWVLSLAEELVSQGVDVIIDKWNLKPGHDANAFMESMVTDPSVSKVLLICDRKYAEKSDARLGGAGTEAQIITPQLYAKREQDKFVAVVREVNDDGTPCLPVYYKGRIYFDLSNDAKYAEEFEGLVRWAWDKPAYVKPELGKKPAFLFDDASPIKLSTSAAFRRAHDAVRAGRSNAEATTIEYLSVVATEFEKFRTTSETKDGEHYDDKIVANITEFLPYRNELIELFIGIAVYHPAAEMAVALHRFFEMLERYMRRPERITSWRDADFDNFKFIVHELFLYIVAALVKYERFELASYLINTEYYTGEDRNVPMRSFTVFREWAPAFDNRSKRLGRLSARADLLKERCQGVGVEFRHLMAADFVLYLRACDADMNFWWPETLLYASGHSTTMELFARAKSRAYFKKIAPMLGVSTKDELVQRISALTPKDFPRWQFDGINPSAMARLNELATIP